MSDADPFVIIARATHRHDEVLAELQALARAVNEHRPHCAITPREICPSRQVVEYVGQLTVEELRQMVIVSVVMFAQESESADGT